MSSRELNSSTRNTYPYNAIVHLIVEFPGGRTSATGALVGKNDILTATHVLYSPELGGYPTKIWVALGADWNGVKGAYDEIPKSFSAYNQGEFGSIAYPSGVFVDTSHTTVLDIEAQNDVAIIALPDPIGLETGWFSMASGRDTPRTANSVGYPGTGSGMMYEQVRVVAHPFLDIYYANTAVMSQGASGGPLFDSDNHIIGVRSAGSSNSALWADLDLHYNELVKYITSNDHYLDKNRIVTLTATASVADEGELINFKLFDSTASLGDQVKYDIAGVTAKDISMADVGGYLTFDNNGFATLLVKVEKDNWTEGREILTFLAGGKTVDVLINDISTTPTQQVVSTIDVSPPKNIDGAFSYSSLKKIVVAHDNSVYVIGYTNSDVMDKLYDNANGSVFASHYSSQGEMLWGKTLGSYEYDTIIGAVVDTANNIYILSTVGSGAPGRNELGWRDILLTKLNTEGALVWEKVFGSTGTDWALDLHLGPDGMLNLVYALEGDPSILQRFDQDGNLQSSFDTDIAKSPSGHLPEAFVIGFDGSVILHNRSHLFSFKDNGILQWKKPFQLNLDINTYVNISEASIEIGLDGSFYIVGSVRDKRDWGLELQEWLAKPDVFVIQKYSSDGVHVWDKTFGGASGSYGIQSLLVTDSGNIYVAGFTNGGGGFYDISSSTDRSVWYVSFDQDGNYISSKSFDGSGIEDIATTKNGDVLLGVSGFGGSLNYTKINSTQNTSTTLFIESSQNMILEGGVAQFKITSTGLTEGTKVGYGVWLSGGEVLSTKGVATIDSDGKAIINVTSVVDNKYDIDTSLVVTTKFGSSGIFVRDNTPLSGDENYALRTDDIGGQAYRIYEAAFGRAPDPRGLGYWISQFDDGMGLIEISSRFIDSNEFKSIYGTNPTNETFITKLYLNVLDRVPDNSGLDWWVDQLDNNSEKTWTKVLADFSESPENIENNRLELVGGVEYISYDVA